jgi:hypothetical protein
LEPRSANPDVKQKKSAGMKHPNVQAELTTFYLSKDSMIKAWKSSFTFKVASFKQRCINKYKKI